MLKKEQIQKLVNRLQDGSFTDSDVGQLFVFLRPGIKDEVLLDLANFITHSDERDRGLSHSYICKYIKSWLDFAENGGALDHSKPVFISQDIIKKLGDKLKEVGVVFDDDKFKDQGEKIVQYLKQFTEGTEFKVEDPRVVKCSVTEVNGMYFLCIQAELHTGVFHMKNGATWNVQLFDSSMDKDRWVAGLVEKSKSHSS